LRPKRLVKTAGDAQNGHEPKWPGPRWPHTKTARNQNGQKSDQNGHNVRKHNM